MTQKSTAIGHRTVFNWFIFNHFAIFTANPLFSLNKHKQLEFFRRDNTGLVVGLVLAVIILAALIAFIAWRFYGKNIQKALGNS